MYSQTPQVFDQSQTALFNQGQPMYAQPAYGQPAYGQPMYGQPVYGQPLQMYMQTPTASVQQSPIIIINDNQGGKGMYCQTCQQDTAQIERKAIGCVAISWGIFYCLFSGIFCFLPCINSRYQDTKFVCVKC